MLVFISKSCLIAVSSKSDNNSFLRWDGAFDSGAVERILYQEASLAEESWPVGQYFLNRKKMPFIALADLGATAQTTSRVVAVIEKLNCQLYQPKTCISSVKELLR